MNDSDITYQWPADFPKGLPENQEVVPAHGKACRLVDCIPPKDDDFKRHRDEKPDYTYNTEKKRLQSYGVSFWSTEEAVKFVKAKYPAKEQFGLKKIVSGEFVPELGVIPKNAARDGHVTLWKQVGAEPHNHFRDEVEE
ncbi:hypothetical protein ACVS2C_003538 [Vibrio parahaemolyticus]|uniref:hypothetical protein n=1 Tax=Vibrio vulnificus TaxID=672 RepID=UPI0028091EB9|nr:hypothetical protein [Vibrio parahaemolyticus]EGR1382666.1 hypothetical protein [Vibrio parahaemolyticus]EJS4021032.1 hypothetical protein [Vibrio parahaemolyticus]ELA7500292.1 hypothetical protein [Vibrio parahaemolyticus]ELA7675157.1 hypothetical protein [Vibrio parahaemolyticus]